MFWLDQLFNMLRLCEERINGNVYVTISGGENYIQLNTYWSEGFDFHKRADITEISLAKMDVAYFFTLFIEECNIEYGRQKEKELDESQDLQSL